MRNSFCIVPFRLLINIDTKTTFIKNISPYIQLFSFERNSLYNSSFRSSETISNSHLGGIITLTTVNFIRSTFKTNCFFPKIPVSSSLSIHLLPIHVSRKYEESLSFSLFFSLPPPPSSSFYHRVCLPSSRSEAFTNGSLPPRFYLLYGRRWVKTSCYGKMFLLVESIQGIMLKCGDKFIRVVKFQLPLF